jgi:hypothetical protein
MTRSRRLSPRARLVLGALPLLAPILVVIILEHRDERERAPNAVAER